jgi:hypothetical protein
MNTVRYVVCGALTGYGIVVYGLVWLPVGAVIISALFPVSVVAGGYYGYWHAKKKQARNNHVVRVLPGRTPDSAHATAA